MKENFDPYEQYIKELIERKDVVKREIKDFLWFYDRESKEIIIHNKRDFNFMIIPERQWFSLFRFLVSAAQKRGMKIRIKK